VTLTPVDDAAVEPTETLTATVTSGTGYTVGTPAAASGSIVDNDVAAVVSVAATDASGAEQANDPIVFTITRSASLTNQLVVNLTWSGAAAFGTDYTVTVTGGTLSANGATLTLAAGSTGATITVRPVDDAAVESVETVAVAVAAGTGYTVGSPASASGTIADNDVRTISVSDATVTEGNKGVTLNVVLTLSSASTTSVTVVVSTVAGTALAGSDFTAKTSTVTFNPGVTSVNFSITIAGDTKAEPTETFTVVLSSPSGAVIGRGTGTVTITDNDSAVVVAAGSAAMVGTTASTADIAPALADAKAWWQGTGLDTAALDDVTVVIADLAGLDLGQTDGSVIRLDRDAAGWGWALDGTSSGIDVRAALAHELGHVLGLSHDDAAAFPIMAEVLPGTARLSPLALRPVELTIPIVQPERIAPHAAPAPVVPALATGPAMQATSVGLSSGSGGYFLAPLVIVLLALIVAWQLAVGSLGRSLLMRQARGRRAA
jgi:hypothetical protein